ncbi:hypothetical protein [Synechococcus sp. KORDI-49]|uniref:hypothetical protein n=1 Tax=Synechococcus sp. KORDI-49 TaxID=585423 RepID=UPI000AA354F6|nr:hypothetical protein [Synechococcus sp. KORDI-49]
MFTLFIPTTSYVVPYFVILVFEAYHLINSRKYLRRIAYDNLLVMSILLLLVIVFQLISYQDFNDNIIRILPLLLLYPCLSTQSATFARYSDRILSGWILLNFTVASLQLLRIKLGFSDALSSIYNNSNHSENFNRIIVRVAGLYPDHSALAGAASLFTFYYGFRILNSSKFNSNKKFDAFMIFVSTALLLLTISKSIILAVFASFAVVFILISLKYLNLRSTIKKKNILNYKSLLAFLSLTTAIVSFFRFSSSSMIGLYTRLSTLVVLQKVDSSVYARIENWNTILSSFERNLLALFSGVAPRIMDVFPSFDNDYLFSIANYGLIGTIYVAFLLILTAHVFYHNNRLEYSYFSEFMVGIIIMLLISSCFVSMLSKPSVLIPFILIVLRINNNCQNRFFYS